LIGKIGKSAMKNLSMKEEEFYEVEYKLKTHLSQKSKHGGIGGMMSKSLRSKTTISYNKFLFNCV